MNNIPGLGAIVLSASNRGLFEAVVLEKLCRRRLANTFKQVVEEVEAAPN